VATAKQVFTEKGSDKMSFSLTAGQGLEARFAMKTAILAFAAKMNQGGGEQK